MLDAITYETGPSPDAAVIWMHGLGADGSDFVPVVPELGLPESLSVRFVFPHAPYQPVTCNGGYVMRAWYDIISLEPNHRQVDLDGIRSSRESVRALIAREMGRGVVAERIVLAGFSQGGAIAYATGLAHPERLAGIVALSSYLPEPATLLHEANEANRGLPVFAAHGSDDDVVSPRLGEAARDALHGRGYGIEWREYPMPHSVCLEEIRDLGRWLANLLADAAGNSRVAERVPGMINDDPPGNPR